ncbi:glycosyltransferase [Thermosulfuriphilus sp.]
MKSRLKIIHVEMGRNLYGGALQVFYLLRGLSGLGHQNILVCEQGSGIEKASGKWARISPISSLGEPDPRLLGHLLRLIRRQRPDILHVHSRRGADFWGALAARITGIKAVITRRVDNPEPAWLARWRYNSFDHVVTISQGIRDVLISEGIPPERITCVHSAIEVDCYAGPGNRGQFEKEFGLEPATLLIGMVAQFIPRKGHRFLVEAAKELVLKEKRIRFVLLGQGPLEGKIRSLINEAGLGPYFILAGFREDLPRLLPCLDLLVHPATMEGLGVSLIQAAAAGVPIVASRVGGVPEIVQHRVNGLLVPPGDVCALKEALLALILRPEVRKKMGEEGRRIAREKFSLARMIKGNLQVYSKVLKGRGTDSKSPGKIQEGEGDIHGL